MSLETTTPASAASTAPLTIDQHVELMTAKPVPATRKAKAPEPEPEITDTSDTDAADDAGEVEDTEDTEATPQVDEGAEDELTEANVEGDEDGEEDEPAPPAIDPPKFWDAEGKESFAKLAPKEQKAVLKYEEQRTKAVAKALQESAEVRKSFEAKQQQLLETASRIEEQYVDPGMARMVEWEQYFASEDADELAQTNPAEYLRLQNAARREKRELDEAFAAKTKAERTAFAEFVAEQKKLLPDLVPELADEKEGPKRQSELFAYLRDKHGFAADRLAGLSAKEAQIAQGFMKYEKIRERFGDVDDLVRKADLYDRSMKLAGKAPAPKPKPQAGPSAPATGQGQRLSSSEARFKQLNSKPSISASEHTELLLLKAKLRK